MSWGWMRVAGDEYTPSFYRALKESARKSAETIVPLVMELVPADSVVDVGCGLGTWLAVFREKGARNILGIDGGWVLREDLDIPRENFVAHDLTRPLHLDRTFDLVVSLEVAEHLPAESAETFVDTLTRLGSTILFSAAIPLQGGVHGGTGHLNEQWPAYWVRLFETRGYAVLDPIRRRVWENDSVAAWYAQNTLLFVGKDIMRANAALRVEWERESRSALPLVHPRIFLGVADPTNQTAGRIVRSTVEAIRVLLGRTLRRRNRRG